MADGMETPKDSFDRDTLRLQSAGHEIIRERNTYRHRDLKQGFDAGTVVRVKNEDGDFVPLLGHDGSEVKTEQILPERGDVALDEFARVLPRHEFEDRYKAWFEVGLPEEARDHTDLNSIPIPDPARWVKQIVDPFSESRGPVEIGYDARKPAEQEVQKFENVSADDDERMERIEDTLTQALEGMTSAVERLTPPKRGPGRPPKDS